MEIPVVSDLKNSSASARIDPSLSENRAHEKGSGCSDLNF
jgi:hypothetical protein